MTEEVEYISVKQALEAVLGGVSPLASEKVNLLEALGRILDTTIVATEDLPPFANSSMDGYALRAADIAEATSTSPARLHVIADIAAGSTSHATIVEGTAARIMTGAPMPNGADAVVPVEDTDEPWREDYRPLPKTIGVHRSLQPGDYVRGPGEDVRAGLKVMSRGRLLRAQEIGVLAALGFEDVVVVRRPRVGILSTGDELVDIGDSLGPGQIRNSNSYAITAQVTTLGAEPVILGVAGDMERSVRDHLEEGLNRKVDLFVSSAGVSVGAYDVVKTVLESEGQVKFWRVRMKPGKPLAFGTYSGIPYLGLPGNPVSALVSFERFARPALLKMAGHNNVDRPTVRVTLLDDVQSDGRESYLRAIVSRGSTGYEAHVSPKQGSHMMRLLADANALIIVPEGVKFVAAGEKLTAMMIDWPATVF